jgi:3-phenylpropionate/trans-cinnamate dioxygenase ferredoxin reductase subunit
LESVQNAVDQAKAAARTITGQPTIHRRTPWFWSDQGSVKLQIAGFNAGATEFSHHVDEAKRSYVVHCFRGDTYVGTETVNAPREHVLARKALESKMSTLRADRIA